MTEVELVRHELESRMREHADAIDKLTAERERYKTLYMELLERCKLLEKGIVGRPSALPPVTTRSSRCRSSR